MQWYAEVGATRHQELLVEAERSRRAALARRARRRGKARRQAPTPAFSPVEVSCRRAEGRLVERHAS